MQNEWYFLLIYILWPLKLSQWNWRQWISIPGQDNTVKWLKLLNFALHSHDPKWHLFVGSYHSIFEIIITYAVWKFHKNCKFTSVLEVRHQNIEKNWTIIRTVLTIPHFTLALQQSLTQDWAETLLMLCYQCKLFTWYLVPETVISHRALPNRV